MTRHRTHILYVRIQSNDIYIIAQWVCRSDGYTSQCSKINDNPHQIDMPFNGKNHKHIN